MTTLQRLNGSLEEVKPIKGFELARILTRSDLKSIDKNPFEYVRGAGIKIKAYQIRFCSRDSREYFLSKEDAEKFMSEWEKELLRSGAKFIPTRSDRPIASWEYSVEPVMLFYSFL